MLKEKFYLKILIRRFWEKSVVGGGLVALQFFGPLKRALVLFISVIMSPLEVLGPLGRYHHPWRAKKNKKTKNATYVIFLPAKITKFHIFADMSLKSLN